MKTTLATIYRPDGWYTDTVKMILTVCETCGGSTVFKPIWRWRRP